MSPDPTKRGAGDPSEEERDGTVLYDPNAWQPPEELIAARKPRRGRFLGLFLLFGGLLAGAGFWGYSEGFITLPEPPTVSPPPPPVTAAPPDSTREATLAVLGAEQKFGEVGTTVGLVVRAMGANGLPIADSLVLFTVIEGEGELSVEQIRTDTRGAARTEVLLPAQAQALTVLAELAGSELRTRVPVSAQAGAPEYFEVVSGDGQEMQVGELLERVSVRVTDAAGNPVPGTDVRFDPAVGGGRVGPSRARTDSLGVASTLWRLGMEEGVQRLTATAVELGTTLAFTATANPRPVVVEETPQPREMGPVTVVRNDFAVGNSHVCQLTGGVANCRGANDRSQRAERSSGLVAIASGVSHLCGLDAAGRASCWGANEGWQLGDGTTNDRATPVAVRTDLRFSVLAAGLSHTCGLAGGGVPICWGQNLNGQIGDGSRNDARSPRTVGGGLSFTALVAGWDHTCGLSDNGNAWCWGLNSSGQLGDGSQVDGLVPALVRGANIEILAAGTAHTCGVSGQDVLCWGDNRFGQLGDGTTEGRAHPEPVVGLPARPVAITAGAVHTCALVEGGSAYCWGQNLRGQLGNGTTENSSRATPVSGDHGFESIHAGGALTCGITPGGMQYCWGFNQSGQLGDGTRQNRTTPTLVDS